MRAYQYPPQLCVMLFAVVLPFASLQAGDDSTTVRSESISVSAQMNDYLQGQKIAHSVDAKGGDFKGDGEEMLTVKIYDVSAETQQNAICTALAATAKKGRVRETTVLFFTQVQASTSQPAGFQPSRLPSGNGEVDFPRDPLPAGYRLLRTVKL